MTWHNLNMSHAINHHKKKNNPYTNAYSNFGKTSETDDEIILNDLNETSLIQPTSKILYKISSPQNLDHSIDLNENILNLERQIISNSNAVWSNLNNMPSQNNFQVYPSYINKNLFALSNSVSRNFEHIEHCIHKIAEHLKIDFE